MLPEVDKAGFTPIEIPQPRRNPWAAIKIVAALLVVGGAITAWLTGYRPPMLQAGTRSAFELAEVDRGDVDLYVVETGSIESSNNTTVRCQVEAMTGLVGGSQGSSGKSGSSSSSGQGAGGSSGQGAGGSGSGAAATSKSKTAKKSGSSSSSSTTGGASGGSSSSGSSSSGSSGSSSSGSSGSSSGSGSGGSGGGSGSSGSSSTSSSSSSSALTKPVLRSFNYSVTPYTPARGTATTTKTQDSSTAKKSDASQGKGGGSSKGGGGGRGGRGGGQAEEKPGSTRIVKIKPEGSWVKAGEVVAELDAVSYQEEERTQKIRYLQAKSYVEQAQSMLEVAEITLREYRDGIYPQDLQLVRQYIDSCRIAKDRAASNLKWSEDMLALNFRTPFQVKGDRLALEQTEIALIEAQGMLERLTKFTAPKIIKSLEANVAAIRSDLLTQEASFSLEDQRLKRIQRNIDHCTVKAPGDGVVVYANQSDRFGQVTDVIDEGVTLRELQPIFNLPDPNRMRVRAKINESKVALVQKGQSVLVLVDAYPDRPLKGVVGDVVPISIPIRGSDVRIYYANIEITEGFDALRPGLSAEVLIQVERRRDVTRVPIDAIRWAGGQPYVALYESAREQAGEQAWRWRKIEVGLSDPNFIEVTEGLKPGDRVIAYPNSLPAPVPDQVVAR